MVESKINKQQDKTYSIQNSDKETKKVHTGT